MCHVKTTILDFFAFSVVSNSSFSHRKGFLSDKWVWLLWACIAHMVAISVFEKKIVTLAIFFSFLLFFKSYGKLLSKKAPKSSFLQTLLKNSESRDNF